MLGLELESHIVRVWRGHCGVRMLESLGMVAREVLGDRAEARMRGLIDRWRRAAR